MACVALAATLSLVGVGSVSARGTERSWNEPAYVGHPTWYLISVDGPREITYATEAGYCVGTPRPRLLRPRVVWRRNRIVLTARVFHPALHFGPHEFCGGVGLMIQDRIRLAHPIAGRSFYDGSESPPEPREPPSR